jgi:transcriptional regulator with XRE-family HTH domain
MNYKHERLKRGLTQKEVAYIIGCNHSTISYIENGKTIGVYNGTINKLNNIYRHYNSFSLIGWGILLVLVTIFILIV